MKLQVDQDKFRACYFSGLMSTEGCTFYRVFFLFIGKHAILQDEDCQGDSQIESRMRENILPHKLDFGMR